MELDTRFNQRIIKNIEGSLLDFDRRFKALSPAEQKKLINEERDRLVTLVRSVIANRGKIPALVTMFGWISHTLLKFLGFDPFKWLCFKEYNHNASFANRAFSNPSLFDALEQAGQILMEKQSPHLKHVSRHFNQKVTSAVDVERAAGSIIDFFKCLPSARNGIDLHISVNDVKQLFTDSIKLLPQSEITQDRFERQYSNPMIMPSGELCWIKYKFVGNTFIESGCICDEKRVDMNVTIWYYWFRVKATFDKRFAVLKSRHWRTQTNESTGDS